MNNEKVFITGCGGMLGNAIRPFFKYWFKDVLATDKDVNEDWLSYLDVRDTDALSATFNEYRPDIVLHLAAETDLEFCETNIDTATNTNDIASKNIAKLAEKYGATLIYISTAGVFDGTKESAYTEDDQPNPIMVYGKTKYAGEIHTLKYCSKSFVIRAGWMMGGGRSKEKKFVYKILKQVGPETKEIFAVDDKWGTPTYTYDFAMNLFLLLETKKYGLYHMVCEGKGTRYDVAEGILRTCNRQDIKLTRVDSSFFAEEYFAPRPFSEMMLNSNLTKLGINHMRPWQNALHDYISNHFNEYINTNALISENEHRSLGKVEVAQINNSTERRSVFRKNFPSSVEYVVHNGTPYKNGHPADKAISVNVSEEGLCLYLFNPMTKGEKITLLQGPEGVEHEIAKVQWVRQEEHGVFKAGLVFQSMDTAA